MFETSRWLVSGKHIFFLGKSQYDVGKLLKLIRRRRPVRIDIELLFGYSDTKRSGFNLRNFYHCNTRYPVVALESGQVVDGRHRLIKMKAQERKRCSVIYVTRKELATCRTRAKFGKRIDPDAK